MTNDIELTRKEMAEDIELIRTTWSGLVDLTALISHDCPVGEDDTHTLASVASMCRRFLEEFDKYQQPQGN